MGDEKGDEEGDGERAEVWGMGYVGKVERWGFWGVDDRVVRGGKGGIARCGKKGRGVVVGRWCRIVEKEEAQKERKGQKTLTPLW